MILVDSRTGSNIVRQRGRDFDMFSAISKRVNGAASVFQLEHGDFCFEGNGPTGKVMIGLERKELGDMLGSMRTDRSSDQAREMSKTYDVCYWIVEGIYRPSAEGVLEVLTLKGWKTKTLAAKGPGSRQGFTYAELDKHLSTLEVQKNFMILRSTSLTETAWQIVNRFQWWQKPWDQHSSADGCKTQGGVSFVPVSDLRRLAAQLPGVGWVRSKAVAKHFGSIENMANALSSEWKQIDGIGDKLAIKLYATMRLVKD